MLNPSLLVAVMYLTKNTALPLPGRVGWPCGTVLLELRAEVPERGVPFQM